MSEAITPPKDITKGIEEYHHRLIDFVRHNNFPEGLLIEPDYVMVKTDGPADFNDKVQAIEPWAEKVAFAQIDWRFLVAAQLLVPLTLSRYRAANSVTIMEAKSEAADHIGVEYTQYYCGDFGFAEKLIKDSGVEVETRKDGYQRWLNVRINPQGQEVRLSDRKLEDVVAAQIESGEAIILKPAA